jgi:hypothetical protein
MKELTPTDAIYYLKNKYSEIKFLFGSNLGIRERDIYALENMIIEKENGDKLKDFGKMILKAYPSSPIGNYYIGCYYEYSNMLKKAQKHYNFDSGKIHPFDPNVNAYRKNILRVSGQ